MKELTIKKLDMITNALSWNFQMQIQLNLGFKIFGDITFEIKSIELYCHIDSNNCEFQIVSTIEFFKFIMEIGVEIDLIKFLQNQRQNSLKMIFRKTQNCPTFQEILSTYSPKIDGILEKIPGYKEIKLNDKLKDLNTENTEEILEVNKLQNQEAVFLKSLNNKIMREFNILNRLLEKNLKKNCERINRDEEISKCKQTIQNAQVNLEKKIKDQIQQQKDKGKKIGTDYSRQSVISKQSYLEFRNNSIYLKFDIPLLDEWKICSFLALQDCSLQINNIEKELNLELKGKIKFLDIPFPEFSLQFSVKEALRISFKNILLEDGFDPIQCGLKFFDTKVEEINIFPKINQINSFIFNFETYEFESEFSFNMGISLQKNSILSFSTFLMRITQKQKQVKQNLSQEISAQLKTTIILFDMNINLNLDFSQIAKYYKEDSNLKLIFYSEPIKNFCLNKFVQNIVSFQIPNHIAEFKIQTITSILSIEKLKEWTCLFHLLIDGGQCSFFQNLIIIKELNGQLIYSTQQKWDGSNVKGKCFVKEQYLGAFQIVFLQDIKKIQANLSPNNKFSLLSLLADLSGTKIEMSIFEEINFKNLTLMLEILESHMIFKAVYKKDILQFENFSFIRLENINVEFQLVNRNEISKHLNIDFQIVLFNNPRFVIDGKITGFPLKVDKFVLPIQQTIFALFDMLEEFDLYQIHKFQLFENCPIKVEFVVQLNKNMKIDKFEIVGTYQGKFEWFFLKITSLSLKYSRQNGKNNFSFEGKVTLLDVYKLQFEYNIQKKTLRFQSDTSDKNQQQMIQLTQSLFEDQKNYLTNIQSFQVMTQKIPPFKELVINFENQSFILELSHSQSQVYKIYINWQSKTLLFYFGVKGQSFGDIMSYFSILDSVLCFQQSECLLVYSKYEDLLDDEIVKGNQNNLIKDYLENQNKKTTGLHLSTKIKFTIHPKIQKFLSFLENSKKEFDLQFNANFANGFEFNSEMYEYRSQQFQGQIQFYVKCNDLQSLNLNFGFYLFLNYVTESYGELTFKGEVFCQLQFRLEGKLHLSYKNVFGVKNWHLKGDANVLLTEQLSKINLSDILSFVIDLSLEINQLLNFPQRQRKE